MSKLKKKYNDAQKEILSEINFLENRYALISDCYIHETLEYENEYGTTNYVLEISRRYQSSRQILIIHCDEFGEVEGIEDLTTKSIPEYEKELGYFLDRTDKNLIPQILHTIRYIIIRLHKEVNKLK